VVYSTCSLEAEEDERVVEAVLAQNSGFHLLPMKDELAHLKSSGELVWRNIDELISGNFLRTIPGAHPCDGFFAAIFEKHP
jgi:16S rRNA (cytosine967-C5)-methyltransferase